MQNIFYIFINLN